MRMRASGTSSPSMAAACSMLCTSLCRKYTWPPRRISRRQASRIRPSFHSVTKVFTASRSVGGVVIIDRSRRPPSAMFMVRGMGVAVSVSTSTSARSDLSRSLSRTPKRCSSSMMTRPRFLKPTVCWSSLWVPITMSTAPDCSPAMTRSTSLGERKRDSDSTRIGQSAKRSRKVWKCCCASSVVGTSIATWRPSCTATNAARSATSVLPKPTSPQITRSIGRAVVMSAMTSSIAWRWSGVSSKGKASRKSGVVLFRQREAVPLARGAARVQVEQLHRDVTHFLRGAPAGLVPLLAAEAVQRRRLGGGAGVAADQVERLHRHVQLVAAGVFQRQELAAAVLYFERDEAEVAADTVVDVHDRRAGAQVREFADDGLGIARAALAAGALAHPLAEQLGLGDDRQPRVRQQHAVLQRRHGKAARPVAGQE
jgi:hypothetical protein